MTSHTWGLFDRLSPARPDPFQSAGRRLLARFGARSCYARTSHGLMHAYVVGEGDPVVLLHGIASDGQALAALASSLGGDHQYVVPDLFDFAGMSRRPWMGREDPLDVPRHTASVVELLSSLRIERAVVAGVSLGAWIALRMAATSDVVERLFLVSPAGFRVAEDELDAWRAALGGGAFEPTYERLVRAAPLPRVPVVSDLVRGALERRLRARGGLEFLRTVEREHFVDDLVSRVRAETFVLAGREDRLAPPGAIERLVGELPNGTGEWVDGASHNLPFDAPANVYMALRRFVGLADAPHTRSGRLRLHLGLRRTTRIERTT